eukprot:849065-Amphidinium_carterae.3
MRSWDGSFIVEAPDSQKQCPSADFLPAAACILGYFLRLATAPPALQSFPTEIGLHPEMTSCRNVGVYLGMLRLAVGGVALGAA